MSGGLDPSLANIVAQESLRWIFVGGKGGVGKTTTSCSLAVQLSAVRRNVLVVSTDPAHNLSDAFDQRFSGTPTLVRGFTNLYCLEIDSNGSVDKAVASEASAPTGLGGMMSFVGQVTKAIPGWDEIMGFATLLKTLKDDKFDCVVFDTAPTGHTLRLLAFPEAFEKLIAQFSTIQSSLGGLLGQLGELGQMGDLSQVSEMKESMANALALLRNPDHTTFIAVCIPEFLSVFETERLVQELTKLDIDIHNVVVNQILDADTVDTCARCKSRRALQAKYLADIGDLYEEFHVTKTPLLETEVRGIALLREYGKHLLTPYPFKA